MIIATTPYVAGYRVVETKGQVFGLVVRSRGLAGNLAAGLRSLVGGEIHEYTSLLEDTRRQAIDRMVQNATLTGANAVISMRFDSSELGGTMSEIVAYGTAVVDRPRRDRGPAGRIVGGRRDARRGAARPRRLRARPRRARPRRPSPRAGAARSRARSSCSLPGIVCLIVPWFERLRYRSNDHDRSNPDASVPAVASRPGRPSRASERTEEVFIDPTSGHPDAGLARSADGRAALRGRGLRRRGRRRRRPTGDRRQPRPGTSGGTAERRYGPVLRLSATGERVRARARRGPRPTPRIAEEPTDPMSAARSAKAAVRTDPAAARPDQGRACATSTASCPGSTSTPASCTRRRTPAIRSSSG